MQPARSTAAAARGEALPGATSPEALVERMRGAADRNDFSEFVSCLTPQSRTAVAMGIYMASTMMVAFSSMGADMTLAMGEAMTGALGGVAGEAAAPTEDAMGAAGGTMRQEISQLTAAYNEVVAKYGLPRIDAESAMDAQAPQHDIEKFFENIDHGGFLADMSAFLDSMTEDAPGSTGAFDMPSGDLSDLVIDGDQATATLGEEQLKFLRLEGRWYAEIEDQGPDSGMSIEFESEPESLSEAEHSTPKGSAAGETSGATIAEGAARGRIAGQDFVVDRASLENNILELRQGEDFFAERGVKIFLLGSAEKMYAEGRLVIEDDQFMAPHVHMSFKVEGSSVPKSQVFTNGYRMTLELQDNAGRIDLRLPDDADSFISGSFRFE